MTDYFAGQDLLTNKFIQISPSKILPSGRRLVSLGGWTARSSTTARGRWGAARGGAVVTTVLCGSVFVGVEVDVDV